MSSRKKNPGLPLNSEVTQIAIALNLTGPQTAILRHISASMSRKSPVCFKSQETLARETRYCKRTISNAIKSLVDMNILLIENRVINGARHHNIYRCNHDENGWHVAEIKGASDALLEKAGNSYSRNASNSSKCAGDSPKNAPDAPKSARDALESSSESSQENQPKESSSSAEEEDQSLFDPQEKEQVRLTIDGRTVLDQSACILTPAGHAGESCAPPLGAPEMPSESDLQRAYGSRIPPECNFVWDRGIILRRYTHPFNGSLVDIQDKFGVNLDKPLASWFESQLDEFYEQSIERNWSKEAAKPGIGFNMAFLRAGRAGFLCRCGFRPKSPSQLEEERAEQERAEAERQEQARLEAEKEEQREKELKRRKELKSEIREKIRRNGLGEHLYRCGLMAEDGAFDPYEVQEHFYHLRKKQLKKWARSQVLDGIFH